ncbi:Ubiquitin-conjugating enzyme [Macleaya cordata]|uniref:Ubiquitin-conjugating enzyme n=1 Tax=Macleaya cordata TaxID=56857 RepID=A0A200R0D5_MACCD|nr:Ubiquitin-conjugating enzyme [Macleaya cordata]
MENHEDIIEIRVDGGGGGGKEFKQFDIILAADDDDDDNNNSSISDHHFASSSDLKTNKYSSQTNKRIMKEWKILEECLPDSIYVRAYEGRIDLLRAVIVGAEGTPYHNGLFFFDIQLPSDYPYGPPNVHYHSFGFRLNPNLYPRGKVCLSLLNTWFASEGARWNPSKSTVLQVLVSIQALVLNAKPYFNESRSWYSTREKESLAYNEEKFVLSCKKMLAVLNKPPKHFEEFVAQHFRDRAETILTACKAYIDDSPVNNTLSSSATTTLTVPKRYQRLMRIIYSRLVKAFIKNGSSSLKNYLGSYDMDVDEKFVEPRLPGEMDENQASLSELIHPLLTLFVFVFLFLVFILF